MDITKILQLAKDIDAGRSGNHASRAEWYATISKAAEAQRKPGETSQMSFARYTTQTDEGRVLWKAMRSASGSDYVAPTPSPAAVSKTNPARMEIAKLADDLRSDNPEMSRSDALAKIWGTHPELVKAAKSESALA